MSFTQVVENYFEIEELGNFEISQFPKFPNS
jgi:hypothetical protein